MQPHIEFQKPKPLSTSNEVVFDAANKFCF